MSELPLQPDSKDDIEKLLERREALRERLAAIRADHARGLDRDSSERAVELENAEVLNEIARVAEVELASVEERIGRARRATGSV